MLNHWDLLNSLKICICLSRGEDLTAHRWAGWAYTLERSCYKQQGVGLRKGKHFTTMRRDVSIRKHQSCVGLFHHLKAHAAVYLLIVEANMIQKPINIGSWYPILQEKYKKKEKRWFFFSVLHKHKKTFLFQVSIDLSLRLQNYKGVLVLPHPWPEAFRGYIAVSIKSYEESLIRISIFFMMRKGMNDSLF